MSIHEKQIGYSLSYSEYLKSIEDIQYEVLKGQIISMSPSPSTKHQHVQRELLIEFGNYLRGKDCNVYGAPIDVCLFAKKNIASGTIKDWVQPDLVFICDSEKITETCIIGAPDLVIEFLSPSTARNDWLIKFNAYQKSGVKVYWIVNPANEYIEVFKNQDQ